MISVDVEVENLDLVNQGTVIVRENMPLRMRIKSSEDSETLGFTMRIIVDPNGKDEVKTNLISEQEMELCLYYDGKPTRIGTKRPIFLGEIDETETKELYLMFECDITQLGRALLTYNWLTKVKE